MGNGPDMIKKAKFAPVRFKCNGKWKTEMRTTVWNDEKGVYDVSIEDVEEVKHTRQIHDDTFQKDAMEGVETFEDAIDRPDTDEGITMADLGMQAQPYQAHPPSKASNWAILLAFR